MPRGGRGTGVHSYRRLGVGAREPDAHGAAVAVVPTGSTGSRWRSGEWSEGWGRDAAGRRIPDDVALVGFDNWEPMTLGAQPPLTSVDMCLEEVGRAAAELLLAAIADEPAHGVRTVPSRLVVRQSSR
jgi:substrate-binding family protein